MYLEIDWVQETMVYSNKLHNVSHAIPDIGTYDIILVKLQYVIISLIIFMTISSTWCSSINVTAR